MKITISAVLLMGLVGFSTASPFPNNDGTISSSLATVTMIMVPTPITRPVSVSGYPSIAPAPFPSPAYCYPIDNGGGADGTVTLITGPIYTISSTRAQPLPPSDIPTNTPSLDYENWGKPSIVAPNPVGTPSTTYPPCPPGYIPAIPSPAPGGTYSVTAPGSATTQISIAPPVSNTDTVTDPSPTVPPQNLSSGDDDKSKSAASSSFSVNFAGTIIAGLVAAAWLA